MELAAEPILKEEQSNLEKTEEELKTDKKRDIKLARKEENLQKMYRFFPGQGKYFPKQDVIHDGDKVLLVENSGKMNLIKVKANKKFNCAGFFIHGSEMIGWTYGTILEKKGKKAVVRTDLYSMHQDHHALDINNDYEINTDNREIVDSSNNQGLSYEEIEFQKSQNVTGSEIIQNIIKNSSTFDKRTLFSQEKYLKKLKKKHLHYVELRYPSLHHIWDYAYELQDGKMINLRYDALGYILNSWNLTCSSRTLVIENTKGIVTSGVVERMGNKGSIYKLCLAEGSILNYQNETTYMYKMNNVHANNLTYINYRDLKRKTVSMMATYKKLTNSWTSWIIVHDKHSPKDLFNMALPFLKPSWYVTVFCEYLQPLAELEKHIRYSKVGVMICLEDFWSREYQVLPLRTHPHMMTTSSSGYVLTFITVVPGK